MSTSVRTSPLTLPSLAAPYVDENGVPTPTLWKFLSALVADPSPIIDVVAGVSPFVFTASIAGHVLMTGGTVSAVTLTRARIGPIALPATSGFFPMSKKDILTITYSVAPTMLKFIPWGGDTAVS